MGKANRFAYNVTKRNEDIVKKDCTGWEQYMDFPIHLEQDGFMAWFVNLGSLRFFCTMLEKEQELTDKRKAATK